MNMTTTTTQQPSSSEISAAIEEFYFTSDETRRDMLHRWLMDKGQSVINIMDQSGLGYDNWTLAFELVDVAQPHCVQYFAACCLYDTVRKHWVDKVLPSGDQCTGLRHFLLNTLTQNIHVQSVINKLSSTLAMLALYSIPDLWQHPITDLTGIWSQQPELLLRVLTELAAEFVHVQLPLNQRSHVKSELHRMCPNIIRIIETVMNSTESSPSLRNAAVECVEQWLKLPGVQLNDWKPVLGVVLNNVINDSAAMSRLFTILAANDDVHLLELLIVDVFEFVGNYVCPAIRDQLANISTMDNEDREESMEELASLLSSVVQFVETVLKTILLKVLQGHMEMSECLRKLCDELLAVTVINGHFPIDECISDVTATFWTSLREELISISDDKVNLITWIRPLYVQLLQSSIVKLAYPDRSIFVNWNLEAQENYRTSMSETSANAYILIGTEVMQYLCTALERSSNINQSEAVIFLIYQVADYLGDSDQPSICQFLRLASMLLYKERENEKMNHDRNRMGKTLMQTLFSLAHLVINGDQTATMVPQAITVCLSYVRADISQTTTNEAMKTLERYVEDRSFVITTVADQIIFTCYEYFMSKTAETAIASRLLAIKCVGYALSLRNLEDIMKHLHEFLSPGLQQLHHIADSTATNPTSPIDAKAIAFEISVLSALIIDGGSTVTGTNLHEPITLILQECLPLLLRLVKKPGFDIQAMDKVAELLRSGLTALLEATAPLLPLYYECLDVIVIRRPLAAFAVVKNVLLVFATKENNAVTTELRRHLRQWTAVTIEKADSEALEPLFALAIQIVKKHWTWLTGGGSDNRTNDANNILGGIVSCSLQVLHQSAESALVRQSATLLAAISAKATESNLVAEQLKSHGERLVQTVFTRLKLEILRSSVEALADTLFVFAKLFPTETRLCINPLVDDKESSLVNAMLREVGNQRVFRQFAVRFNMAERRKKITHCPTFVCRLQNELSHRNPLYCTVMCKFCY